MATDMKDFHGEVKRMQYQFHDHLNKPGDPLAKKLNTHMQQLEDDLQVGRHNPYDVKNRLKTMRDLVKQAGHDNVVNYSEENKLHHWLDHHINNIK